MARDANQSDVSHRRLVIEPMHTEDEPVVRRLLRQPMDGTIRVSLECEPNMHTAAAVEGEKQYHWIARDGETGELAATFSRTVAKVWVNGQVHKVGYLSKLRRVPGRGGLDLLRNAYAACEATRATDELPFDLTTIVADNQPARRLLERGLPGLPTYTRQAELVTCLLPFRGSKRIAAKRWERGAGTIFAPGPPKLTKNEPDPRVFRNIHETDPALLAAYINRFAARRQFARVWEPGGRGEPGEPGEPGAISCPSRTPNLNLTDYLSVNCGGRVIGCVARWDQRPFKQTVIRGYSPQLARIRHLINMGLMLRRQPRLPRPGSVLGMVYLSHLAVDDDNPNVMHQLIDAAQSKPMNADYLAITLAAEDPLLQVLDRFRPRRYRSILYLVHRNEAWPSIHALDDRIPYLEAATL